MSFSFCKWRTVVHAVIRLKIQKSKADVDANEVIVL